MPRTGCPLTPHQVRILAAVAGSGSRALEIATRSGTKIEVVYPSLARLVSRGMLEKRSSPRIPIYLLTEEGARQLAASLAYQEKLRA